MFDLTTSLANDIAGQKRTGKTKQFVFIRDDFAYKGPYQQARLNNIMTRSQIFTLWNTPCVVKAVDHFRTNDGIFIRYPNIMAGYQLESEPYLEGFSGLQYKILKNAPVVDVRQALSTNAWIPGELEDVIVALCHCYILGIGDMNLRNTLVDPLKHQFFIIDFDDNLGTDRDGEMFYFNKPPAKKLMWYEKVGHHYNKVADRLVPLLQDQVVVINDLTRRVQRTIDMLRQYAKTREMPVFGINQLNIAAPVQPKVLKAKHPTGVGILTIPQVPVIPPPIPVAPVATPPIHQVTPVLTLNIIQGKQGQMIWKGLRGGATKTYSGIDLDVAKSALQKYIRRNVSAKAILSAIELYRMGEVGGTAGVTNMYNRLSIIAAEDIGPANLSLALEVIRLVESDDRDIHKLVTMVQFMSESPKTRMMSHAWRAYAHPEGRAMSVKMGLPIDTTFTESDLKYVTENKNTDLFLSTDPESIRPYVLVFLKRLYEKDFNAFGWAQFFLDTSKEMTIAKRQKFVQGNTRCTTGKPDILLWKALSKVLSPEIHDILSEAYFNHGENRPFLQMAILTAINRLTYEKFDIDRGVQIWKQQQPVLNQMMNGDFHLEIDPYVIDKHTQKGRALGKGIQDFVDEGATVIPQNPDYYNETLEKIYRNRI